MTATTKADKPIPLSELVPKSRPKYTKLSTPKLVPNEDGLVVIETPLPCLAYLFMLPFPFLCMGCCLFQQSRIILDDASRLVTVHVRNGACPCATKRREFSYSDIGNVAVVPTSMRVNGVRMHTTIFLLRDATRVRTGRLESKEKAYLFAREVHRFLFGRTLHDYVSPALEDMLLLS